MINLLRIFSDTGLFKPVTFHSGVNLILGVPSGKREGRELNGVGKSTLVRLIDFALVGDTAKSYFVDERCSFLREDKHSFEVEFTANGSHYRIRRTFARNAPISFGKTAEAVAEYTESEAKDVLAQLLIVDPDYAGHIDTDWYRSLIRFFITDDKSSHQRTDPLNWVHSSIRKSEYLAYNYYLLNLPNQHLVEFDRLSRKLKDEKEHRKQIEARIKEETGKAVQHVRSDLDRMRAQIDEYKESLETFQFLEDYQTIEVDLREVTSQIAEKMRSFAALKRRLAHLEQSYALNVNLDVEHVTRLYGELDAELASFVRKRLDEVITFRQDIAANRKKFLIERERGIRDELVSVESQVVSLEVRRSQLLGWLQERKALDAIRNSYERIAHESEQYERSASRVKALEEEERKIAETNAAMAETIVELHRERQSQDTQISEIRRTFFDILKNTIYIDESVDDAFFDIKATNRATSPLAVQIEVPKRDSLGKSRFKLPVYDLTVFLRIVTQMRRLPHFLVHDGVLNGVDVKTVVQFLKYIKNRSEKLPTMQYLVTLNEDQVMPSVKTMAEMGDIKFDIESAVVAHYGDVPERMIFGREY